MDHGNLQSTGGCLQSPATSEMPTGQIYVKNRPAFISLLPSSALARSPLLPGLIPFINTAFRHSKDYLPTTVDRLQNTGHLLDNLGSNAFTILVTQSGPAIVNPESKGSQNDPGTLKVIATVSAAPYKASQSVQATEVNNLFNLTRPTSPLPSGLQIWELKLMVVDVSVQKQGLASKLLGLVMEEVRRRAEAIAQERRKSGADMEGEEIRIIFSTIKEQNYKFYMKRGFVKTVEKQVKPGMMGSRDGFTIVEMMKKL